MIERTILNVLIDSCNHFPIVLLTGPRQTGKSTLLYHRLTDRFSYISLDDRLELSVARNDPRSFLAIHPAPLIIDEAQKAPELFPELERIVNESRLTRGNQESNGMYILSGSQKTKLLERATESLAGRVAILEMNNLSYDEIIQRECPPFSVDPVAANKRLGNPLDENHLFSMIYRGFFPGLYDDLEMKSSLFYSSYIATYFEKDLREELQIEKEGKYLDFLKILASNTGQEFVYDNYAKEIGVSVNTIKSWVSATIRTGIIYFVEPYHETSIVKRVVKRPKMYFFDTGLAAYLCQIDSPVTLQTSFLRGRFFETFVFNEIRKSFSSNGLQPNFYYYRDSDQNEVDLVLIVNGGMSLMEIKTGQEFHVSDVKAFRKLSDTKLLKKSNAIICNAPKISVLSDGTYILPATVI